MFLPSWVNRARAPRGGTFVLPRPQTMASESLGVGHLVCVHVGAGRPGAQAVECRVAAGRLRVARPLGVPGQEGLGARVRPPRTAAPLVGGWRGTAGWGAVALQPPEWDTPGCCKEIYEVKVLNEATSWSRPGVLGLLGALLWEINFNPTIKPNLKNMFALVVWPAQHSW